MRIRRTKIGERCALCGIETATTKDHVPPKGIFDKPRPSDLITVPACKKCNNGDSDYDEIFKIYLGLQVGRNGINQKGIGDEAIKSARRRHKVRSSILSRIKLKNTVTKSGVLTGEKVHVVNWDEDANQSHKKVISRTVKGLYYHHFDMHLKAEIDTYWFKQPPSYDQELFENHSIGNGKFIYSYAVVSDEKMASAWFFQFYGAHWAGAITIPKHLNYEQ